MNLVFSFSPRTRFPSLLNRTTALDKKILIMTWKFHYATTLHFHDFGSGGRWFRSGSVRKIKERKKNKDERRRTEDQK